MHISCYAVYYTMLDIFFEAISQQFKKGDQYQVLHPSAVTQNVSCFSDSYKQLLLESEISLALPQVDLKIQSNQCLRLPHKSHLKIPINGKTCFLEWPYSSSLTFAPTDLWAELLMVPICHVREHVFGASSQLYCHLLVWPWADAAAPQLHTQNVSVPFVVSSVITKNCSCHF